MQLWRPTLIQHPQPDGNYLDVQLLIVIEDDRCPKQFECNCLWASACGCLGLWLEIKITEPTNISGPSELRLAAVGWARRRRLPGITWNRSNRTQACSHTMTFSLIFDSLWEIFLRVSVVNVCTYASIDLCCCYCFGVAMEAGCIISLQLTRRGLFCGPANDYFLSAIDCFAHKFRAE